MFLILLTQAFAEDATFVGAEKPAEEPKKPETRLSAEFGGVWTSGNTMTFAINGSIAGSHKWGMNKLSLAGGANVGQSVVDADANGTLSDAERATGFTESARKYYADGRYDRFVSKKSSLYVLAGGYADRFAGYDSRVHGQVGYSFNFVDTKKVNANAELGADVANEDYVAGVEPNTSVIAAARVQLGLTWTINENVALSDTFEFYENLYDSAQTPSTTFDNFRFSNGASLTSKLSDKFSLKLSHTLVFDQTPVSDDYRKLDQTTMVTFVASLL